VSPDQCVHRRGQHARSSHTDTAIIEVPAIPDAMPEFTTTYDLEPHADEAGFDDSAWPIILPTELEAKRGGGKVSFLWFRTPLTTPNRIGAFDPAGAKSC
jgi:hypothetical protein